MRSTSRLLGVSFNAISRLLTSAAEAAWVWHDETVLDLDCPRIEADELKAHIWVKPENLSAAKSPPPGAGASWTWVGFAPDTKLVVSYWVGDRGMASAVPFMKDLQSRLARRVQLTTDGHVAYPDSVEIAFGGNIDHAVLVKTFGTGTLPGEHRSRHLTGTQPHVVSGDPDFDYISTAGVERSNLTTRMSVRRFARRTNAFSKRFEKHVDAVALHFWNYNFVRPHLSLRTRSDNRVVPAMVAGLTHRPAKFEELVSLIDELAPAPRRPRHYKKRAA